MPEWAGYDAQPQDQREFPDLSPIRGRDARARDGRAAGEWVQDAQLPDGPGYGPGNGPGYGPGSDPGYPQGQGAGQAPWADEPWPNPAAAPSAGPGPGPGQPQVQPADQPVSTGPSRSAKHRASAAPAAPRKESDWAGPADPGTDPMEAFSERWIRRGSDTREDRRTDRRKRRRLYLVSGGALAVIIAVAVYFLTSGGGNNGSANLGLGSLVRTFLPGEFQQVPNSCGTVPSAALAQYLPGQLKVAEPPLNTGAFTQCTWTLDKAPLYRVLEVSMQAYSPSGLASGDGSATFAAEDAYAEAETAKQSPGPHSGQPKATVSTLSAMPGGNDTSAFEATQVFTVKSAVTDVATVVVRYRNVIVTVVLDGLDQGSGGKYGPVSMSDLTSAAQTVAQDATGTLVH